MKAKQGFSKIISAISFDEIPSPGKTADFHAFELQN